MAEERTYFAEIKCKNCKVNSFLKIKIGISVKDHCLNEELKCSSCGVLYFEEKEKDD